MFTVTLFYIRFLEEGHRLVPHRTAGETARQNIWESIKPLGVPLYASTAPNFLFRRKFDNVDMFKHLLELISQKLI